jgi:hypothetical protein
MIAAGTALAMLPFAVSPAIERLPNKLPRAVTTILFKTAFGMGVLFVVSLVVIVGFILCNMRETAVPNADYVVVLAACCASLTKQKITIRKITLHIKNH